MEPLLISIAHAAEMLGGVSVRHVYRLIQNENLPVVQLGKRKKAIPLADLKMWIAQRMAPCHNEDIAMGSMVKKEKPWLSNNKVWKKQQTDLVCRLPRRTRPKS